MTLSLYRIMFTALCVFLVNSTVFATPAGIGFEVLIIKPDDTPLEAPSVDFKFKITDPLGTCVIYIEELSAQDMTGSQGQKSFTIGNPSFQTYPDPMVTPLTIAQVFSNSSHTFACQSGGSYISASTDKRQLLLEFNDGSGAQALSTVDINSVPFALEAANISGMPTCTANQSISFNGSSFTCVPAISSVSSANSYLSVATTTTTPVLTLNVGTAANTVAAGNDSRFTDERTPLNNSVTSAKIVDGTILSADISASAIQSSHLSQMGAGIGQVLKWDGASWVASSDNSGSGNLITSVAGRTGAVTLSSGDISGLTFGTTAGTFAQGNDSRFTDQRNPINDSVTSAKILDGTIAAADLSSMDASAGQVMKWNGSAWIASNDNTGGGGSVTSISASGPLSSTGGSTPIISIAKANGTTDGYLSSADFTIFSNKLSDFSSLLSSDITSKLGYTPVNPATAVTSVAGRTGVVTLSSSDITGLAFGTTTGTYAQGNDSRFTDQRNPINDSVTSAKILDGTIAAADLSSMDASAGQVMKWNGSAWIASNDNTGGGGSVTSISASGPLSSTGGSTPIISIAKANGTTDGYLSSADFTIFSNKLSDFSSLLSSDITSKLGYTPVNPATAVTSVAGRTGVVTLSSSDITGLAFGTTTGTYAQGNDSRFTDQRNPINDSVTSAKILDGAITSSDISTAAVTFDKLNQSSATSGQVIKWNGSAWVASSDDTGAGGTVTSVSASGPLSSTGGSTPIISIAKANGTTDGYLSSADFTTFSNKLSDFSSLLSSDITTQLGYTPVNPSTLGTAALLNTNQVVLVSNMPTNCSAGQTLTFSSPTGSWLCSNIVLGSGTVTSAMISSLDWTKVVNTPTTVAGYGIPKATAGVDGYLSSADFTIFSNKLSDFSSLLSSDITSKLGYTPVNPATAVTSVAGRTGVVTLSSSDITGLAFGTTAGTFAQGNDSRFTDTRTPTDNTVTSAKIVDGTIVSSDVSAGAITFDKFNQSSATSGQVIKWNGSGWAASADSTGAAELPALGGTAASPGYAFSGDPNTGIFSTTANTIGFSTNGTEKMRILSNGNVGIGMSSPWDRFSVYQENASVGASIISDNTSSNTARYPYLNVLNYLGSPANGAGGSPGIALINMRGNSSASVAMQSSEALGSVTFNGSKNAAGGYNEGAAIWAITSQAFSNSAAGTSLLFYTTANDTTGSVSRMIIDQSGKVGIGVSSPSYALQVSGDISVSGNFKINGTNISAGTVTSVTSAATPFNPIIVGGSGSAPTLDIPQATASVNGYLSSSDFTTFSNKLSNFSTLLSSDITTKLGYTPVNPSGSLKMTGQIASGSQVIVGGTTSIDWNSGNIISTDYDCTSDIAFANLVDGGTYTLIVTSTGTAQCNFSTTTTGVGAGTVSYRYKPANAARTSSSHSIYTLMRSGSNVYVSWTSGF
jgi:dihydroxyacetone kinase DhaKLM complex PTS-EIIA-like component DhaM